MTAKHLLAATALTLLSPLVFAHAHLKAQLPAADATVAAPAQLTLSFSEGIEAGFSSVSVTAADGKVVALKPLSTADGDKKTLVVSPVEPLAAGTYQVRWQVLSVDTHKSAGDYRFTVGQ
jgi:methionine-rich copper-binding protein CopC